MKKHVNLQPWLDYFSMLQDYGRKGLLEVSINKHEAYITQAALHSLSGGIKSRVAMARDAIVSSRRIRAYAAWKGSYDRQFLSEPFSLHVVKEEYPHDTLYTILLSRRRKWWKLWMKADVVDVIDY